MKLVRLVSSLKFPCPERVEAVATVVMIIAERGDQRVGSVRRVEAMMDVRSPLLLQAHLLADKARELGDAGHPTLAGGAHDITTAPRIQGITLTVNP